MGHFRARIQEQIYRDALPDVKGTTPSREDFIGDLVREIDAQVSYLEVEFAMVAAQYAAIRAKHWPGTKLKRKKAAG